MMRCVHASPGPTGVMMSSMSSFHRCLLLCCALLVGCGETATDEGDDETGHPPAAMVGMWIFQSATENGTPVLLADALEWDPASTAARLHIEGIGTYVYEEVNSGGGQIWSENGWIFVDPEGGTIVVHVLGDSDGPTTDEYDLGYTLVGGLLTLEQVEGGSTFVYTLQM